MKRNVIIEWFLRCVVFGAVLIIGIMGALSVWSAFQDYSALLLFVLVFALVFILMVYIVRKRHLGMLETR
jgi:hypothetical protein